MPPGGPNSFISMQFSAKKIAKNRLAHPFCELAHPPRENPGSATAIAFDTVLSFITRPRLGFGLE